MQRHLAGEIAVLGLTGPALTLPGTCHRHGVQSPPALRRSFLPDPLQRLRRSKSLLPRSTRRLQELVLREDGLPGIMEHQYPTHALFLGRAPPLVLT